MAGIINFFLNDKKLSSHMDQTSEHINSSNHKIYSYGQMRNIIVNLGIIKWEDSNKSTYQLNHLHNLLLMSIVDTPEKSVSNVVRKLDKRKIRTSSIKSSSTLFIVQYVQRKI